MMKIIEKIRSKKDIYAGAVTIALLGDSVTHGCFECFEPRPDSIETVFDIKCGYATRLREILNILYPQVQINLINGGISGDNAVNGARRLARDILPHHPDLTVVAFALNDCSGLDAGLDAYADALAKIFDDLTAAGSEIIFLTPNEMCNKVSCHITEPYLRSFAEGCVERQNGGMLKKYVERAKEVCAARQIPVCDLYSVWETMEAGGVETTDLLSNYMNHPIRPFHYYMAIKLIETMFGVGTK